MTKYTRVTGKVFGASADPTGDNPEIGQFGSALATTYLGTSDISTIQSLPAWSNGFIGCVTPNTQFPPLPEMTGFGKVLSQQICYILQQGVPEYDSGTTYYDGNWCAYNKNLYTAKADGFSNVAPTDTTKWDKFTGGFSRNYGEIVTSSLPLTDTTLHLADGSLLNSTDYPEFVSYVANLYNSLPSGDFSQATQNTTLGNNTWTDIVYGNGKYIALNQSGYVSISTNGTSWTTPTEINNSLSGLAFDGITFDGSKFVLLAEGYVLCTSTDGVTWTITSLTNDIGPGSKKIIYGNGKYIAFEKYTSSSFYYSADGINWTNASFQYFSNLQDMTYINNKFYALGQFGETYLSDDGINWTESTVIYKSGGGQIGSWNIISYDGLHLIAISTDGYVSTSSDGLDWTGASVNVNLGSNTWNGLANASLKTVAIGQAGYISIKEQPYTNVFTTEANWQATYTTYRECGKYVYDSVNNTVRIPLYNSYFTNTTNPQSLGSLTEASLPNIRGAFNHETTDAVTTGAFSVGSAVAGKSSEPGGTTDHYIDFNAASYNSIYKDSATTVNTQSIKQLVYIVVAK